MPRFEVASTPLLPLRLFILIPETIHEFNSSIIEPLEWPWLMLSKGISRD
jgi:hypothetical protein